MVTYPSPDDRRYRMSLIRVSYKTRAKRQKQVQKKENEGTLKFGKSILNRYNIYCDEN